MHKTTHPRLPQESHQDMTLSVQKVRIMEQNGIRAHIAHVNALVTTDRKTHDKPSYAVQNKTMLRVATLQFHCLLLQYDFRVLSLFFFI